MPRDLLAALSVVVVAVAVVVVAGCGGQSGPVTVHLFGLNPETSQYGEFDANLDSIDDVTQMRGRTVEFVGNATLTFSLSADDVSSLSASSVDVRGGASPDCSFSERDGVLHADDYDSLNMASSYFALDRSRKLFIALGLTPDDLNVITAYYHPRLAYGTKLFPTFFALTDNAAYASELDGFLIVPHIIVPGAPFTTNQGVMTHEYGHKVFNLLVEHRARQPVFMKSWSDAAQKQYAGVNEGFSDEFGFLITHDPDYIRASLDGVQIAGLDRDMSAERVMTADYADGLLTPPDPNSGTVSAFDPHELGAYVAAALWRLGEDLQDHRRVALAVLATERELGAAIAKSPEDEFSTLGMLSRLANQFQGTERQQACDLFKNRFATLIQRDTTHFIEACP